MDYGEVGWLNRNQIGDLSEATPDGLTFYHSGAMLLMGTEESGSEGYESEALAYYLNFKVSNSPYYCMKRWVPHVAYIGGADQFPHAGSFKSMVKLLPKLSNVKSITLYYPKENTGTGTTEVLDVDVYFNQSKTSWGTKTLTRDDGARGYKFISIGEPNVNSIQLGLTWRVANSLRYTITPVYAEIEYEETKKIK